MEAERKLALDLLERTDELRNAPITAFEQLAGDMSTRRYYRVTFGRGAPTSAILVTLSGALGPVGGGPRGLTQDDTYVEISSLLSQAGIRVPRILVDARDRAALLVEDVGSTSLLDIARNPDRVAQLVPSFSTQGEPVYELFLQALVIGRSFKSLDPGKGSVVYQRRVSPTQRSAQIREFLEHYAKPRNLPEGAVKITEKFMDVVCEKVAAHPPSISHFDFMASNIHVLPSGELCLIDFQDMCLDSPARDVVSLLNDRGVDEILGQDRQQRLLSYFMASLNSHSDFASLYDDYLLHWDFRVSGRFALLSDGKGVARYRAWIPSTLRRLGRTLGRVQHRIDGAAEVLRVLSAFSPEISYGAQNPWGGV